MAEKKAINHNGILDDAKKLIEHYNKSKCYSFECNPDCLIKCKKKNIIKYYKISLKYNTKAKEKLLPLKQELMQQHPWLHLCQPSMLEKFYHPL